MKRLCKVCTFNDVTDEKHLIFNCNQYSSQRKRFSAKIASLCKHFTALSQESRLFWLKNNESEDIILLLYIYDCFQLRNAYEYFILLSCIHCSRVDACMT